MVLDCIDSWSLQPYLLWLSELFCLCCVAALKSLPALSFNALIFPILRIVCTISFHSWVRCGTWLYRFLIFATLLTLWSPAGKGLTSWLSFVVSSVSLSLSHWYPGSGVVLDCIDSWSLQPYYFYNKLFLTSFPPPPPWPIMPFLYDVLNVKPQLYAKGLVWSRGGKHFSKTFSISYMLNSKNSVFNPYFLIGTGPMRKTLVRIIRELKLLSFSWKKYHLLWNFFLTIFMGYPSLRLSEVLCSLKIIL